MGIEAANGLARILKAEGVPWVSTFPTNGVNNALGEEGVPLVMMRDERYAVALADAFSRVTNGNRIGVCTVMGGLNAAGLQMAFGALAQAYEDGSPLLCITDGVPVGATGTGRFDIADGLRAVTKWVGEIDTPERVPEIMRRAFTHLRTGRPAPVLVTLPRRVGEYDEEDHPYAPVKGWRTAPDPSDVRDAVGALLAAKKPLLYAGEGVLYAGATDELRQFAELAGLPVVTTLKAKSAIPENHPLSAGTRGAAASKFVTECDLLLAVGASLGPGHFGHAIPPGKTLVHCTIDQGDLNVMYEVHHAVIGDAKLTLQALIAEFTAQGGSAANGTVAAEIRAAREEHDGEYRPLLESDDVPINPYRVYGDLMKTLDMNNSFVTGDSGNTRDQLSTVYQPLIPRGFLGWGNVSTLGFGLAAAMAAKLAYPDRQCVNVTGEAGLSYMLGNMEPLVRHKVGVTTVHISNGGFSGYGPGFWGGGHDPYTHKVLGYDESNMAAALGEMGYYSERVTEPGEVVPALERALAKNAEGRPAYLEIICSQYPVYARFVGSGF